MRCQNRVPDTTRALNGFVREMVPLLQMHMQHEAAFGEAISYT